MSPAIVLAPGLKVLANPYPVDGRVSWHAPDARGYASANNYLVHEGRTALLIDTGLTIHRDSVLEQLKDELSEIDSFSLYTLRQGEFDSVCNLLPILETFDVDRLYGQWSDGPAWGDFHPDVPMSDPAKYAGIETIVIGGEGEISLGADRVLQIHRPTFRLLTTHWVYDSFSRTLFTSDSFGYSVAASKEGPWVLDGVQAEDTTSTDDIHHHLLSTRYWWLADSDLTQIRSELETLFSTHAIDRIAPAFGRVIEGRELVARHVRMFFEALDRIEADQKEAAA